MNQWPNEYVVPANVPSALSCFKESRNAIRVTKIFEHGPKRFFLKSNKIGSCLWKFYNPVGEALPNEILMQQTFMECLLCARHIHAHCLIHPHKSLRAGFTSDLRNRSLYLCFFPSVQRWTDSSEKTTLQRLDFSNHWKVQVSPVFQDTSFGCPWDFPIFPGFMKLQNWNQTGRSSDLVLFFFLLEWQPPRDRKVKKKESNLGNRLSNPTHMCAHTHTHTHFFGVWGGVW